MYNTYNSLFFSLDKQLEHVGIKRDPIVWKHAIVDFDAFVKKKINVRDPMQIINLF